MHITSVDMVWMCYFFRLFHNASYFPHYRIAISAIINFTIIVAVPWFRLKVVTCARCTQQALISLTSMERTSMLLCAFNSQVQVSNFITITGENSENGKDEN